MKNKKSQILLKATIENYDDYYAIRRENKNSFWTGYRNPPNYESFKNWFLERIEDTERDIYLLYIDDKCVGSLHVDFHSSYIAIGYSVKEAFEGNGYATTLVSESIKISKQAKISRPYLIKIIAWINSQNYASIKVVEKNGFVKSKNFEKRQRFDKNELYCQYDFLLK